MSRIQRRRRLTRRRAHRRLAVRRPAAVVFTGSLLAGSWAGAAPAAPGEVAPPARSAATAEGGFELVADLTPPREQVRPDYSSDSSEMAAFRGRLFFAHGTGDQTELWSTDGSEVGTSRVADIRPGATGSRPNGLTAVGPTLFFTADDGVHGDELWRTDGTGAGTSLVADLATGPASSSPSQLTRVGGLLYFSTGEPGAPAQLWRTDGTTAGTVAIAAVEARMLTATSDGAVWFTHDGDTHGRALWRTDGTAGGTGMVADLDPRDGHSGSPTYLTAAGDRLFFQARDAVGERLWVSDGTEAGTTPLTGALDTSWHGGPPIQAVGSALYFAGTTPETGTELWRSDGTVAGTGLVADLAPGPESSDPALADVGGWLFLAADDGVRGRALWASDGTESGTRLVRDLRPDSGGYLGIVPAGRRMFLFSTGPRDPRGEERALWTSDGTSDGTRFVADLGRDTGDAYGHYGQGPAVPVAGHLFVELWTLEHGRELWSTAPATLAQGTITGDLEIVGTPVVGAPLWAEDTFRPADATRTRQWYADVGYDGAQAVPGATGRVYRPDQPYRTVRVEVAVRRPGYRTRYVQAVTGDVEPSGTPAAETLPTIRGDVAVGSTLTVDPGRWTPSGVTFDHAWLADRRRVATGRTFRLPAALLGARIEVVVTATARDGRTNSAYVGATAPVARGTLSLVRPPAVTGRPAVGRALRLDPGRVSAPATVRRQWLRDGRPIRGATGPSYRLRRADRGHRVTVRVTWQAPGYRSLSRRPPAVQVGPAPPRTGARSR